MFKKIMQINTISLHQYQSITQEAQVLKEKNGLPGVLLNKNNLIIKFIYKRNLFSSSSVWPYALRFKKNSLKLKMLGIKAPEVEAIYYYPILKCYLVTYDVIPGQSLVEQASNVQHLHALAYFTAKLHAMGIYFRDAHLNNLIRLQNDFALIDIHSLKFYKKPLRIARRAKNISRMFEKLEDKHFWNDEAKKEFLHAYLTRMKFPKKTVKKFTKYLPIVLQMLFSHEKLG